MGEHRRMPQMEVKVTVKADSLPRERVRAVGMYSHLGTGSGHSTERRINQASHDSLRLNLACDIAFQSYENC